MRNKYNLSLSFYVNVIIGLVFIFSAVCIVIIVDKTMRQQALSEAETKAKLIPVGQLLLQGVRHQRPQSVKRSGCL